MIAMRDGRVSAWACPDCLGDVEPPSSPEVRCAGCGRTIGEWDSSVNCPTGAFIRPLLFPDAVYDRTGPSDYDPSWPPDLDPS